MTKMLLRTPSGTDRARTMLNDMPDRFQANFHMDQMTFTALADWIMENAQSYTPSDITVEESLFIFLDIVAQGNGFRTTGYEWHHNLKLTQSIFLNIMNALELLHEKERISPGCPLLRRTRSKWRVMQSWQCNKTRWDGKVTIGDENGTGGLDINKKRIETAIEALNNFSYIYADSD